MSLTLIQKELESNINRLQDRKKVNARLKEINENLKELTKRQKKLDKEVKKEQKEYERLEKASLSKLFHKVLGNEEEKLEQERQEYLDAVLKYNECVKDIELVEYELGILERKRTETEGIEEKIEDLLDQKEKSLVLSGHPHSADLKALAHKRKDLKKLKKEIKEAFNSGKELSNVLARIQHHLKKAIDWGRYQGGGSNWARQNKYGHIDKARELLYHTKRYMQVYQAELRDVFGQARVELHVQFPNFNSFSDMFFNNLITDWIFNSKVQGTIQQIRPLAQQVKQFQNELLHLNDSADGQLQELEEAKRSLLMKKI